FRILLFVSRPDILSEGKNDVGPHLISRPLFNIIRSFPEDLVTVEVARPGTWKALRQHLRDAKARGVSFDIVHLDVHGVVKMSGSNPVYVLSHLLPLSK